MDTKNTTQTGGSKMMTDKQEIEGEVLKGLVGPNKSARDIVLRVIISKDSFRPSAPWKADVEFRNGKFWTSWHYGYKSKKNLLSAIHDTLGDDVWISKV
jgi:hypothetical protein